MKRIGHLMDQISDLENIEWAYWKARRRKQTKKEVLAFDSNLAENLWAMQRDIQADTLAIGNYHFFTIHDPKERQICAASFAERILHHAIMNVCHQSFEDFQVYDSYATRQGKGTEAAVNRAAFFHKNYRYFLKIDCRKYFDSIDHDILKKQLCRRFKDDKLLSLLFRIIDSYETAPGKGLPIGNLTSQYFANHYLAHADRFLTETLKVPAMVRYMDDLLVWSNTASELSAISSEINLFCDENLKITFKHCYQNKTEQGVAFLGLKLIPTHTELARKSKERLTRTYMNLRQAFESGNISEQDFHKRLNSLFSRPLKVKSHGFRSRLIGSTG